VVIGGLIAANLLLSWFNYTATVQTVYEQLRQRLEVDLASTSRALATWMHSKTLEAEVLARRSGVRASVVDLMAGNDQAREPLRTTLREVVFGLGFDGFAVVDRQGTVLLGADRGSDGDTLGDDARESLARAFDAPSVITPPLPGPFDDDGQAKLLVLAAIEGRSGPVAALLLTLAPERQFADVIANGRDQREVVAYAFDRHGRLLNDRAALLAGRGLDTILGRPPPDARGPAASTGIDVHGRLGHLLPLVAEAIHDGQAVDIDGGADHTGTIRVSAASWFDPPGMGLYIGIDRAAAMRPVTISRLSIVGMSILLFAGSLATVVYLLSNRALNRRLAQAQATIAELGHYQLTSKLGEGGMGAVYLATHRLMRREVAVKLITGKADPEAIARFEREVQLCCTLTHPNTIQIYDYGRTDDGTFYYAMELLRGIDLEVMVHRFGPLPPARVIHLLRQACGSLAEAHDLRLIHRDIKPANLFLCERGGEVDVVKVLDFGLVTDTAMDPATPSHADIISGTPHYMAPEIMRQDPRADGRSDLYSLACVGYFLLTGRCVFEHGNPMRILMDHLNTPPVPPSRHHGSAIPGDLEAVIMRGLAKDPTERFPDARAMASALTACADADGWTATQARAWWTDHHLPPVSGSRDPQQLPPMAIDLATA
jgi:hypothetical protein